ncbi:MAG TPA: hypothetical protein VNP04_13010, partial [Alphaproteobacteria bacterium]|nr:hypothetical protein [Alphaproteobacteria bacterium]
GTGAAQATTASSTLASNLGYLGIQGASGALTGTGTSGLQYDIQHGRDFTAAGFFEAVGIGAASGLVSGVLGGLPGMPASQAAMAGLNPLAKVGITLGVKGVAGGISSDVSQLLTNAAQHQPWSQGLASSFGIGFAKGAATGALSMGASKAWSSASQVPRVAAMVDRLTKAATSTDAIGIYMTTGFFLVSSYVIWGAWTLSR